MDKVLVVFPLIVIIFVILVAIGSQTQLNAAVTVTNSTLSEERFVGQITEMSNPASPTVKPQGKIPHQIVFPYP
jgi:hypothetical protein